MLRLFAAPLCLTALAGCASGPAQAGPFTYACAEGKSFTAAFNAAGDTVTIAAGGDSRTLPQAISASGARFESGGVEYWSKGKAATLEGFPGGPFNACATR